MPKRTKSRGNKRPVRAYDPGNTNAARRNAWDQETLMGMGRNDSVIDSELASASVSKTTKRFKGMINASRVSKKFIKRGGLSTMASLSSSSAKAGQNKQKKNTEIQFKDKHGALVNKKNWNTKMLTGESWKEYCRRMGAEKRQVVNQVMNHGYNGLKQKKKSFLDDKRKKEKQKRKQQQESGAARGGYHGDGQDGQQQFMTFDESPEKIAFAEVAMRPPTFTVLPKDLSKKKMSPAEQMRAIMQARQEAEEKEQSREDAIAAYRQLKLKRKGESDLKREIAKRIKTKHEE
jgi:hypothetical protein